LTVDSDATKTELRKIAIEYFVGKERRRLLVVLRMEDLSLTT